MKYHRNISIF
ncbi:hypothetical protein ACN38_g2745, partial [Penicillium nordicum]